MIIKIVMPDLIRRIVPFNVYNYSPCFDYMSSVQSYRITKTNKVKIKIILLISVVLDIDTDY